MSAVEHTVSDGNRFNASHGNPPLSACNKTDYVVIGCVDYYSEQQNHTCKMNISLVLGFNRFAPYQLDYAEKKPSAVQSGYRKKIYYTDIYGDKSCQIEQ